MSGRKIKSVTFRNNTKKENGNRQPSSFRRRRPSMANYQADPTWIDPRMGNVIRNNIRERKKYGLPSPFANDDVSEDPVVVTAVKDPETGRWMNKICNGLTKVCFYAAIAAAATKAKGLWGGTRRRRSKSKA